MIEQLTDKIIEKNSSEYSENADYNHAYYNGQLDARQHYEKELQKLKDLFYITPMIWKKLDAIASRPIGVLSFPAGDINYIIDLENYDLEIWHNDSDELLLGNPNKTIDEAKAAAESHRMEQMIAQGLRKVEI